MRKDKLYVLGSLVLVVWIGMTYFLFVHRPKYFDVQLHQSREESDRNRQLKSRIQALEERMKAQKQDNEQLLDKVIQIRGKGQERKNDVKKEEFKDFPDYKAALKIPDFSGGEGKETKSEEKKVEKEETEKREELEEYVAKHDVMPILMFACNRPTVSKAIDSLLAFRKSKAKFPIIVSQDCGHAETKQVLVDYGDKIILIEQPDQSEIPVPPKEKKFHGYFKIARHYGWALNHTFLTMGYSQVVVVEDDLEFAPDFFSYFEATLPVLQADQSLMCVSAWNDNGKEALIDEAHPETLYRTDFFGGLGWMLTKALWAELGPKWPKSYWDDWIREPAQRRERACIRPEISRTKTFGKIGVSNGLFFDKHLKFIKLNDHPVDFSKLDLGYLKKDVYDQEMQKNLNTVPVASVDDLNLGRTNGSAPVRIIYHHKLAFKKYAKVLGTMDDFKSGVPRMAYKGVVSTMFRGRRVYLSPNLNWQGYDPTWA